MARAGTVFSARTSLHPTPSIKTAQLPGYRYPTPARASLTRHTTCHRCWAVHAALLWTPLLVVAPLTPVLGFVCVFASAWQCVAWEGTMLPRLRVEASTKASAAGSPSGTAPLSSLMTTTVPLSPIRQRDSVAGSPRRGRDGRSSMALEQSTLQRTEPKVVLSYPPSVPSSVPNSKAVSFPASKAGSGTVSRADKGTSEWGVPVLANCLCLCRRVCNGSVSRTTARGNGRFDGVERAAGGVPRLIALRVCLRGNCVRELLLTPVQFMDYRL